MTGQKMIFFPPFAIRYCFRLFHKKKQIFLLSTIKTEEKSKLEWLGLGIVCILEAPAFNSRFIRKKNPTKFSVINFSLVFCTSNCFSKFYGYGNILFFLACLFLLPISADEKVLILFFSSFFYRNIKVITSTC